MRLEGIGPSRTNRNGTMSTIDQNMLLEQQRSTKITTKPKGIQFGLFLMLQIHKHHSRPYLSKLDFPDHPRHSTAIPPKIHPSGKNLVLNFSNKMVEPWYFYPWYGAIFSGSIGSQSHDMNHGWTKPMGKAMGRTGHPPCPHVTGEILTCSISSLGCAGAIEPCQFSENLEK